jgi:hypothetical protein
MNSLPFISHRMFVAAVKDEYGLPPRRTRDRSTFSIEVEGGAPSSPVDGRPLPASVLVRPPDAPAVRLES